jgi:hypothetical protein
VTIAEAAICQSHGPPEFESILIITAIYAGFDRIEGVVDVESRNLKLWEERRPKIGLTADKFGVYPQVLHKIDGMRLGEWNGS